MTRTEQHAYLIGRVLDLQEALFADATNWPEHWDEQHLTWLLQRHVSEMDSDFIWPGDEVFNAFTEEADSLEDY